MLLRMLGELSLDGSDFREQKPLLLLAYLSLTGAGVRSEIAERFWSASGDPALAQKGLQEALRKLRRLGDGAIVASTRGEVATAVPSDVALLHEALDQRDHQRIANLYRGPFLAGVERNRRLHLGTELREWIVDTREELHGRVQEALLRAAEDLARNEDFAAGAHLAWRGYRLGPLATYLTPDQYLRCHALLLAGGMPREAEEVAGDAADLYDDLAFAGHPYEARARLTLRATLPAAAEPFIGRDEELALLLTKLQSPAPRIITLLGPPGIGKTELAIAVAHEVRERQMFPRGLAFVPCEALPPDSDPGELLDRIATALHLGPPGRPEPGELAARIGSRRTLVVLDNMEHLVHHGTTLAELVSASAALTLLITSRRVLDLEREQVVALGGLAHPRAGEPNAVDGPAVRLFVEMYRRRAGPEAAVDPEIALHIARLTGGLPLALLLAAGWARAATPDQIADRLAHSLDLLTVGPRDLAERRRGLVAALDTSIGMLTPEQRATLGRLVVFREGFDLQAAEGVAGAGLFDLRALIDHSLLRHDIETERYAQHPLVRRYAQERLTDSEHRSRLGDIHAHHYLARLQEMTSEQPEVRTSASRRLEADTANIAAAWRHAAARGWTERLANASEALEQFADTTARYCWGLDLLGEAEAGAAGSDAAQLRARSAWLHLRLGAIDTAMQIAQQLIDHLPAHDPVERRVALRVLGACHGTRGEYAQAMEIFEQALRLEEPGSGYEATVLANLGLTASHLGQSERAEAYLERAIAGYRRLGRIAGQVQAAQVLSTVLLDRGAHAEAVQLIRATLPHTEEHGYRHRRMNLLRNLAAARIALGDLDGAEEAARASGNLAAFSGTTPAGISAATLRARVAAARNEPARSGAFLIEAVEAAGEQHNASLAAQALVSVAETLLETGQAERAEPLLGAAERLAVPDELADAVQDALARLRQHRSSEGQRPAEGAAAMTFAEVVAVVRKALA